MINAGSSMCFVEKISFYEQNNLSSSMENTRPDLIVQSGWYNEVCLCGRFMTTGLVLLSKLGKNEVFTGYVLRILMP
jgi:hypothetical protein